MTYTNQSREKIVLQLLTINHGVVIPDEMIKDVMWPGCEDKISYNHMGTMVSKARAMLPSGTIERVWKTGYIYRSENG